MTDSGTLSPASGSGCGTHSLVVSSQAYQPVYGGFPSFVVLTR